MATTSTNAAAALGDITRFAEMRKRNVRLVTLGNGLYPTPSRAKQFGLREAELADLFWDGINVDYDQLHAAGERLKKALADG